MGSFGFGVFVMAAVVLAITAYRVSTRRRQSRRWVEDEPRVVPESMPAIEDFSGHDEPLIVLEGANPAHPERLVGLVGLLLTVSFGAILLALALYVSGSALAHLLLRIIRSSS